MKMAGSNLGKVLGILAVAGVLLSGTALVGLTNPAYADLQLVEPDPTVGATECGNVAFSSDGLGQMSGGGTIQVELLADSTIEQAYLYGATVDPFFDEPEPPVPSITVTLDDGVNPAITHTLTRLSNNEHEYLETYRADVTTQMADSIGAAGGIIDFTVPDDWVDPSIPSRGFLDGIALVVIYSNPALPEGCVAILDGGLAPTPAQTTIIGLAEPIDKTIAGFQAILAIGSEFSFQESGAPSHECGESFGQFSTIDVNGERLTSCAGHFDDAADATGFDDNLITVGGVGDDLLNPSDPFQEAGDGGFPRVFDDELYEISSFLDNGDTEIEFVTENTSEDDNLFLFVLLLSGGKLSVGEICGDGIDNDEDGQIDEGCTVTSYDLDLFEGVDPSDLVLDLGQEATAVAQTDDATVTNVTFTWIDPTSAIADTEIVPLTLGSAESMFTPDQVGTWTVVADFGNGVVIVETLDIDFLVIPESPIGIAALMGASLAALGAFMYLRKRSSSNIPTGLGI